MRSSRDSPRRVIWRRIKQKAREETMTTEEIAVSLAEHGKEIGSLKHRVGDLELETRAINDLAMSTQRMAVNMENMLEEQKRQGERLESLEGRDGKKWREITRHTFTALISIILGYIFARLGLS